MTSQPEKIRVELGDRSYDILVDSGLIDSAGKAIRDAAGSGNLTPQQQVALVQAAEEEKEKSS